MSDRINDEYLPEKVKNWWNSLSESRKAFWLKRAAEERQKLAKEVKPYKD